MKKALFILMILISGFVFWDLFVRDNPPMSDIEGVNFIRAVKGVFELIIGISCFFIAIDLAEIGDGK